MSVVRNDIFGTLRVILSIPNDFGVKKIGRVKDGTGRENL